MGEIKNGNKRGKLSERQTVVCKSCLRVKAAKTKNRGRKNPLLPGRNGKQEQCVLLMGEEDEKDKEDIVCLNAFFCAVLALGAEFP